jgi:hypothetical protein
MVPEERTPWNDPSQEDSTYVKSGDIISWAGIDFVVVKVNESLPESR